MLCSKNFSDGKYSLSEVCLTFLEHDPSEISMIQFCMGKHFQISSLVSPGFVSDCVIPWLHGDVDATSHDMSMEFLTTV